MKRIKYISHYGCKVIGRFRFNSPASDSKKEYYFEILNRCGYAVDHISRAACSKKGSRSWSYVEKRGDNTFRYFASWCVSENKYIQFINKQVVHIQWLIWLLLHLNKGEQVMIYHSLGYDTSFLFLRKIKQLQIIGDIEEIYQDVHKVSPLESQNEYRFIDICTKFIFPSIQLNDKLNHDNRPYVLVHGIYRTNNFVSKENNDGKIHLLYSGTFDPVKGGALAAIKSMEYLPEQYNLHVTGFGNETETKILLDAIVAISKKTKATLEFHGYLCDDALIDLMHSCSIGLCTQDPYHQLNSTSFPSKILNYMSNGLSVLSGRNQVIRESAVGDLVYFYDEQEPSDIARAIMKISSTNSKECYKRLELLDKKFCSDLKILLEI